MKLLPVLVIFIVVTQKSAKQKKTDVTLNVKDRVALLKFQITRNIKQKVSTNMLLPIDQHDFSASYEYVDIETKPITPIMDSDERKKHGKYRLRELITNTEKISESTKKIKTKKKKKAKKEKKVKEIVADDLSSSKDDEKPTLDGIDKYFTISQQKLDNSNITNSPLRIKKTRSSKKPFNIFYRRIFPQFLKKQSAIAMVHCQDLISPVITGQKTNLTDQKLQNHKDREVSRLIQLLNEETEGISKEEIYSILYQISNLQIRLFRWDVPAIKLLLNVITKDGTYSLEIFHQMAQWEFLDHIENKCFKVFKKSFSIEPVRRHSFRTLKSGLKRLFVKWHLDISNVTNLMKQARLFRPLCIMVDNYEGSTKTSVVSRFTTKKVKKPKCSPKIEDHDESCEF